MRKAILPTVAVVGFTILLSFFAATYSFAQTYPHSEEYMQQHDGGDRAEYLQEMEHSDPWFYVPPVSDASRSISNNNGLAN
ncbi:MAG: hypothetical protein ACR2IS_14755 [Nitrososphaeraceae archaeon]